MNEIAKMKEQFLEANEAKPHTALQAADEYRGVAEIQAQLVIAQRFPRDTVKAIDRIVTAFGRQSLAESAEFDIPKGGTVLTGETIRAMEAIAQQWGNINFEWRELFRGEGYSDVQAQAWDLQSNTRRSQVFRVRHWIDKKDGGRPCRDEREIYELLANMASRRLRSCLKAVIPSDVTELAIAQSRETLKSKVPFNDETKARMLVGFSEFGVTKQQIEKRIGRHYSSIERGQYLQLRRVYQSLRDGMAEVGDFFETEISISGLKQKHAPEADPKPDNKMHEEEEKIENLNPNQVPDPIKGGVPALRSSADPKIVEIADPETGEINYRTADGDWWDADQHSFPPKLNADGTWRRRRGASTIGTRLRPNAEPEPEPEPDNTQTGLNVEF